MLSRTTNTILPLILVALAIVGLASCDRKPAQSPGSPAQTKVHINAVATVGMVGDFVKQIGGEYVNTTVLLGPGTDPHLYKPTPSDIRTLRDADIIFASGLHLEGKMEEVLRDLAKTKPVIFVTDSIPRDKLVVASGALAATLPASPHGVTYDPHAWFDVSIWSFTTSAVETGLGALAPNPLTPDWAEALGVFQANAVVLRQQLTTLDAEVRNAINTIPQNQRVMVTAHDAFQYFGRAYNVEVLGIQGISTESEASLQKINDLVRTLVDRKIPAVFVESSVSPKNIESLRQGAASKGHDVKIGGQLFSDAMGAAGTPDGTYPGMVRHNIKTIVEALGGSMPQQTPVTQPQPADSHETPKAGDK
ncbi:MAG: zinc ABC transporter substrate-binding protein [Phycisphaerales bacterium]